MCAPCCMPARQSVHLHALLTLHATLWGVRRLDAFFARQALPTICASDMPCPCKPLAYVRNGPHADPACLSHTHRVNSVAVSASGKGPHMACGSIKLRAHRGNDCHCERPQNIGEQLIKKLSHLLPMIGYEIGRFGSQAETVGIPLARQLVPAAGDIWASLLWDRWGRGIEGVNHQNPSSQISRRPMGHMLKVEEVADSPTIRSHHLPSVPRPAHLVSRR